MHAIFIGASAGCGLHAVINLLNSSSAKENRLTLLLRTPSRFTENPEVAAVFKARPDLRDTVKIVQGDALQKQDIQRLFGEAGEEVELVVSSIGGKPDFSKPFSPTISPTPEITQITLRNLIPYFHLLLDNRNSMGLKAPRLIAVSSMGLGKKGHQDLPFMLKWMYGVLLKIPHDDKLEMEKLIIEASGKGNEEIGLDKNDQGWLKDFISE